VTLPERRTDVGWHSGHTKKGGEGYTTKREKKQITGKEKRKKYFSRLVKLQKTPRGRTG